MSSFRIPDMCKSKLLFIKLNEEEKCKDGRAFYFNCSSINFPELGIFLMFGMKKTKTFKCARKRNGWIHPSILGLQQMNLADFALSGKMFSVPTQKRIHLLFQGSMTGLETNTRLELGIR